MKQAILILITSSIFCSFYGWKVDYWELLEGIEQKAKFLPQSSSYENKIKFSKAVERLEGKKIRLQGYFVQGSKSRNNNTLTFYKHSNPVFTPKGPNLYEMVALEKPFPTKILYGKKYLIEGVLRLNAIDRFELPYKLEKIKLSNYKEKKGYQ